MPLAADSAWRTSCAPGATVRQVIARTPKWPASYINGRSFFGVVGRRNGPPRALRIETSAGEKLLLLGDGSLSLQHPSLTETKTDSGSQLQLSVRDEAELKEMLVGVKRRFPELDVEKTLQSAPKPAPSYPKGMVKLTSNFGGELSGRSVVKSAVAFAKHLGIDLAEFRTAREYSKSADGFPCGAISGRLIEEE